MFDIGGNLAAARKGHRLTPADAERLTCLRGKYLAALESNNFDALPGRVYARAFLRTYADALGLDADRFVEEFDERYPEAEEAAPPPVIRPHGPPRLRPGVLVALLLVAATIGFVAWSSVSTQPKVTTAPPPRPVRAASPTPPATRALTPRRAKVAPRHVPLVIRATAGPCWLLVRRGGADGRVLYEGTLQPGQSLRFAARVWMRLGAPWNVAARRGAHVVAGLKTANPVNLVA